MGLEPPGGRRLDQALAELSTAVALRPVWPYAWAAYAEAKYRAGAADAAFEAAVRRAVELGPFEPAVQETVALYGLPVWDVASPGTRAAIERALQQACAELDADVISLDITRRYPFPFKHSIIGCAVRRGIAIELCYSAATARGSEESASSTQGASKTSAS